MTFVKRVMAVVASFVMALILPISTYALTETQLDNFAQNNILFYDPDAKSSGRGGSSNSYHCSAGNNQNYAGDQVWSDASLEAIEANRDVYEEAAKEYGFPWQVLAVIHYHESGLKVANPQVSPGSWAYGQGIYGLYSYTRKAGTKELDMSKAFLPTGPVSREEFLRQTKIAAKIINDIAGKRDWNDPLTIKHVFFQYNGKSQTYVDKALKMGFTEEEAWAGEGSFYVMNRYDAQRDPTSASMSPYWPGRYIRDGVYDATATSNGFGAFVQYEAIGGGGSGSGSVCSAAGGTIAETAMNLSWEGAHSHAITDPKPEYETAMHETGSWFQPCNSSGCPYYGASCDQFVGVVMRYSGADPDFPTVGPGNQERYMIAHPDMYTKVETDGDVSMLQPGDIFVTNVNGNHIYLYVGEIDGKQIQASASWGERTGEHFAGVYFSDSYGRNGATRVYSVYRRINY